MNKGARIFVAGHRGLVGGALLRQLQSQGFEQLITRSRAELDLCDQSAVESFFNEQKPEYVFLAAAKVGGILANSTYPAEYLRDNLLIQTHTIDAAWRHGARKLLFLGSSCIYPRLAPQPMPESCLLTGPLESTNEWYAIAKIAGLKMCQAYRRQYGFNAIGVMPTNLYGPGDHFNLETSHVLPALIRKFHEAKQARSPSVSIWGSGTPRREFLHVQDLAQACIFLMNTYDGEELVNIGVGQDISIAELARLIATIVGFTGELTYDSSKPDGTPRKLLDVSRLTRMGWKAQIPLAEGIDSTYRWFVDHHATLRR